MLNLQKHGGAKSDEKPLNDLQNAKKILRGLSEYSTRVDEFVAKCGRVEELFSPSLIGLRGKIRDCTLLSVKNGTQGLLGILDLSWRKGSYEVMQIARRLKKDKDWSSSESAYLIGHIDQCLGFYNQLLMNFQPSLDFVKSRATFGFLGEEEDDGKEDAQNVSKAVYKCLVFMGDLMRYKLEFCEDKALISGISKKYYHQALAVDPHQGQPYNQLAALSGSQCQGLVGIYYYLRSSTSDNKFDGADSNLKRILGKSASLEVVKSKEEKKVAKHLSVLLQDLLFEESTKNLSNICRQALESVMSLVYSHHQEHQIANSNLASQVSVYGILSLLLAKEKLADEKSAKRSMIDAFLLAWFTHLTTKVLADMYFNLFGPDAMMDLFQPKKAKIETTSEPTTNGKSDKPKKGDLRRRRKKIFGDSDSDITDESADEDSDSNSGSFQFNSDDSENDDDDDLIIEETQDIINVKEVIRLFQNHPMLESFQLCCYWLMATENILKESGENGQILWTRLTILLNTVTLTNEKYVKDPELDKIKANPRSAFFEDKISRGMKIMESRHKLLDFSSDYQPSQIEVGLARFHQISEFKKWLSKFPNFALNEDILEYDPNGRIEEILVENGDGPLKEKAQLMENMAHLWLQQEVKDLEGHEEGAKGKFSLYLIVDHSALIHHMFAIQDIVATKRFAVIIPTAVVQHLDSIKKEEGRARNAIRWLERQFQHGNHWLRGQKSYETKVLANVKYPQKRDKEAWNFVKILECCNHFCTQGYGAATLLTAANQDLDLVETAKDLAMSVETVEEFITKCKIPKKFGGNRAGNRAASKKKNGMKENG